MANGLFYSRSTTIGVIIGGPPLFFYQGEDLITLIDQSPTVIWFISVITLLKNLKLTAYE